MEKKSFLIINSTIHNKEGSLIKPVAFEVKGLSQEELNKYFAENILKTFEGKKDAEELIHTIYDRDNISELLDDHPDIVEYSDISDAIIVFDKLPKEL